MSYYDDHMNAVAERVAERLRNGTPALNNLSAGERSERWFLRHYCDWSKEETDAILKRAKQINERSEK